MKTNVKMGVLVMLALFAVATAVHAGTFASLDQNFKFELERKSLTNVNDAAGRWQHEGGEVYYKGVQVGDYAIHRRVTWGGTDNQNTAMLTMTIFFFKGDSEAPQNITMQGSHDFSSGEYVGSVSAASQEYLKLQGAYFIGDAGSNTLLIVR